MNGPKLMSIEELPVNCPRCLKIPELCVCEFIAPQTTKPHVLILQHPQEPDKDLGSAQLAHLALPNSTLKIGLSWPNLSKALGREVQAARWAVLYLGSGMKSGSINAGLHFVSKKGEELPEKESQAVLKSLEGIVVLDGTWTQAKALWWRNAWLLKLKRAILVPSHPSMYRELRKEPRRECLSTIETIAESLRGMGEPKESTDSLVRLFSKLLEKQRARVKETRQKKE